MNKIGLFFVLTTAMVSSAFSITGFREYMETTDMISTLLVKITDMKLLMIFDYQWT
jgi:hypothetical protein